MPIFLLPPLFCLLSKRLQIINKIFFSRWQKTSTCLVSIFRLEISSLETSFESETGFFSPATRRHSLTTDERSAENLSYIGRNSTRPRCSRRIKFEVKSKSRGNRFSRGKVNGEIHVFGIVRVLERIAGLVVQKIGECRTPR